LLTIKKLRSLLQKEGLHPSKKRGQNFLIDGNIRDRILDAAEIKTGDIIVEIGPGLGALTEGLLNRGAEVWAVEKDSGLHRVLKKRITSCDLNLLWDDALKVNWKEWLPGNGPFKLVANLPYNITSPLLLKLLENRHLFSQMIIMVQKEVGERFTAAPGSKDYGALTLKINYYARTQELFTVSPGSFYPRPDVTSLVLQITPRANPAVSVKDEKKLFQLIEAGFAQRRKTFFNNLRNRGWKPEKIRQALDVCSLPEKIRGEELKLKDFACMADFFSD